MEEQNKTLEAVEEKVEEVKETVEEKAAEIKDAIEEKADEVKEAAAEKVEEASESMADYEQELSASFRRVHEGDRMKGTVISVDEDKVMVDLNYYTEGIMYKQDVSDDPSLSLPEALSVGQEVEATVVRADDHGRIRLSMKAAAALAAWERLENLLKTKESVSVKIADTTKAGAVAYLEGVRAFIPASKLSLGFVPEEELKDWVGKTIEARVITAEHDSNRLVLSAKDILREKQDEERKSAMAEVKVGLVTEGTVETIKDYGAFVNIGHGVTGLLHVSQISQKRIKTPSDVLKEGQTVKVKVTKVADGRISLSMKALDDSQPAEETSHEEHFKLPKSENIGTGLGDLLKGFKFD